MDHKQILSIILFGSLREVERPCNHGLPINHHDLVVGYGVLGVYFDRNASVKEKGVDEYFCVLWLLSRMTSTLTPLLWAFNKAFAIGADVKE